MKKRILSIIMALMLVATVLMGINIPVKAVDANQFNISLKCGFDNSVSIDRYVPFYISVANSGKDFTGKVQLIIPNTGNDNIMYEQEVSLPTGVNKTVEIVAPVECAITLVNVRITDKKGRVITSSLQPVSVDKDCYTIRVGVLSDDFSACGYMDNLELLQSPLFKTKIFELSEKNISENWHGLNMMDVIVISDYSTDLLTDAQKSALYQWADNGGLLIIGTGPTATKTLSGINNVILDCEAGQMTNRTTSLGLINFANEVASNSVSNYIYYYDEDGNVQENSALINYVVDDKEKVDMCQINFMGTGVTEVTDEVAGDVFPIYQYKQVGRGYIVLTAVDFTKNPLPRFVGTRFMMVDIIDETVFTDFQDRANNYDSYGYNYSYNYNSDYSQNELMENLEGANMIPILLYSFILIAFFISLLVIYLVARKKKKTISLWLVYPIVSAAVAVVIFCISLSTKVNKLTLNVGTVMELKDGMLDETNYTAVIVPRKGDYSVNFSKEYDLDQKTQTGYHYFYEGDVDYDIYKYKYVIDKDSMETCINDAAALTTAHYKLKDARLADGGLELAFDGTNFIVTNNLGYEVDDVIIIYKDIAQSSYSSYSNSRIFYYGGLDKLKSGDSASTADMKGYQDSYIHSDDLVAVSLGQGDSEYLLAALVGNLAPQYKEFCSKRALIDYIWDEYQPEEYEAMIIAFPKDEVCKPVLADKKGSSIKRNEVIFTKISSGDISHVGN